MNPRIRRELFRQLRELNKDLHDWMGRMGDS